MKRNQLLLQLTSHYPNGGEVFNDNTIATAIIDRLVHHSSIIKITGRSYRIKDMVIEDDDINKEA